MQPIHWPLSIVLHVAFAAGALLVGVAQFAGPKGNRRHRLLGWIWVALMSGVAATSVFIRDYGLPNLFGYTPIHLFTVLTIVTLPLAIVHARRHDVVRHAASMKGLFVGGLLVAGLATLIPGRRLGNLLWTSLGWIG
ncbi:MAG: DUF2306 domain-containing protein [Burkholderiaceae bacterium]|nr:DUF2306 domain-containing protein [Burkholderiaceae bacterium]GIL05063.1 MAG: membrane protein [Betaproteobacteria bacterium]